MANSALVLRFATCDGRFNGRVPWKGTGVAGYAVAHPASKNATATAGMMIVGPVEARAWPDGRTGVPVWMSMAGLPGMGCGVGVDGGPISPGPPVRSLAHRRRVEERGRREWRGRGGGMEAFEFWILIFYCARK